MAEDDRKLLIVSNAFKIEFVPIEIYKYTIKLLDARVTRELRIKVLRRFLKINSNYIGDSYFENDSLYSIKEINTDSIRNDFTFNDQRYEISIEFNQLSNYFYDTSINWLRFIENRLKKIFTLRVDNIYITDQCPVNCEQSEDKYTVAVGFQVKIKNETNNNTKLMISRKAIAVDDKYSIIERYSQPEFLKHKLNEMANISKSKLFDYIQINAEKIKTSIESYGLILNFESEKNPSQVLESVKFIPMDVECKTFYKVPETSITWTLFTLDEYDNEKMKEFESMFEERAKLYGLKIKGCKDRRFLNIEHYEQILYIFQNLISYNVNYVIFGMNSGLLLKIFNFIFFNEFIFFFVLF